MKRVFCFVISLFLTHSAFSWTASHKRLAKELEYVVPYIKEKLNITQRQQLVETYCLAPDHQQPLPASIIGTEGVEYLKSVRIFSTIQFSDLRALPHMHYLLIEALKKRKYDAATYWTGCISHVINDAASPHHLPSIYSYKNMSKTFSTVTPAGKKIEDVETSGLYVERIFNLPSGLKVIRKLRNEYKPNDIGDTPEKTTKYLASLPIFLRNASFKHAEYLIDNFERCVFGEKPLTYNGELAVAKLGTIGISATADVLNSAWNIAANKTKFKAEDILETAVEAEVDKQLAKRTLIQMPLFKDVYSDAKSGMIGVLAEPYLEYQQSSLGYASRLMSASIMGSLKAQKLTYRSLNLLTTLKSGLPSPKEMPILVVSACNVSSGFRWIKKRDIFSMLQKYSNDGGRILWIASDRATFLGELSFSLKTARNSTTYTAEILKEGFTHYNAILTDKGEDGEIKGTKTKKFPVKYVPDAAFDWSDLKNVLEVSTGEQVVNLVFFKDDNDTVKTVGAYLKRADAPEKAQHIAVSSLFFFQNQNSPTVKSFSSPQLDEVSESILINMINLLK